jgi:cytochrome b involved in lipid metabolism
MPASNPLFASLCQIPQASMIIVAMSSTYTRAEVSTHNTTTDLWIINNDEIYDVTEFQKTHPGGDESMYFFHRSTHSSNGTEAVTLSFEVEK